MRIEDTAEPLARNERSCLRRYFLDAARRGLALQRGDGAMPAGHNGPYLHSETPVRNTAHWAISFTRAWELSGDSSYRLAAERAIAFLLDAFDANRRRMLPCRRHRGKDFANGLMGQAWAIEGLAEAGRRLQHDDALRAALELFLNHPYHVGAGGWQRLSPDGSPKGFDWNFNHQLWFCASGALVIEAGFTKPEATVRDFCRRIPDHLQLYPSGLIRHANNRFLAHGLHEQVIATVRDLYYGLHQKAMWEKSLGYHCFNTYALAMIERCLPDLALLRSATVSRALEYACSEAFWSDIATSPYGFPYNPPGWEAALSIEVAFPERQSWVERWLKRQRQETYDPESGEFLRQARDLETARARLYEVTRLI